jgi:SulP family sulfate permease
MAALLFIVAWGLIDVAEMRRIVRTSRGDALVLIVTFVSTLALQLEFAIFVGVLASLLVYLQRTTHPHLTPVVPDPTTPQRRSVAVTDVRAAGPVECPQLALLRVDGSLFFGAVEHVRDELHDARMEHPDRSHILLIGTGINFIDVAGAELLVAEAKLTREAGGTLYLCNLKPPVRELLERGGFLDHIGRDCVFPTKAEAIREIYARLDAQRCERCTARIFTECATTLPDGTSRAAIAAARNP